jgi:hypothetical protein
MNLLPTGASVFPRADADDRPRVAMIGGGLIDRPDRARDPQPHDTERRRPHAAAGAGADGAVSIP